MRTKLEITFDADEQDLSNIYTNAVQYHALLADIKSYIREQLKYKELTDETHDSLTKLREYIYEQELNYFLNN